MELILTPDVYEPSIDSNGNFIDKIPSWSPLKGKGMLCGCGSRKDKVYETITTFTAHIKTKAHRNWIEKLNANKVNLYMENSQLKRLVNELRQILFQNEKELMRVKQQYEIELSNKQQTLDCLTQLLSETNEKSITIPDFMNNE